VNIRELDIPAASNRNSAPLKAVSNTKLDHLISLIRGSNDGSKFRSLFDYGDLSRYEDDHSRGDLALTNIIAKEVGFNEPLIDGVFRQSELMRAK